ncbi:anti-phage-associated DUF3780 domain-containing protein [Hydrogenophaga sp.]|uniref:anti-phage-associated DUF3780 domain-containing protein n=1 Tax=Hydrogenophaga sp. TaxID=1904254 RepID=UPI00271E3471|nr:anti-phage-associated DUF3780 domain-containing protein [Hydrogenophaga sp.]MDO9507249.1 DUF3780 domain-containing protein [Hydrogenophaga sp.]
MTRHSPSGNPPSTASPGPAGFVGFGASAEYGAHVFTVNIPAGRSGDVVLTEEYGYLAGQEGTPEFEIRAILPRAKWGKLADAARKDFNARLRSSKVPPSTWKPQANFLDRMLGKELCVLMWAAEHASEEQLDAICIKWTALRPEERWWLYAMTVAQGGLAEDGKRGWRKALFYALSDIEAGEPRKGRRVLLDDDNTFSLFG